MGKPIILLAAAALLTLTAGCGIFRPYSDRMADIHPGMSPSEVAQVLGNPEMRGFEGNAEKWQYYYYVSDDRSSYVLIKIVFIDGKVYSMDSHRVDRPLNHRPDADGRPGHPGRPNAGVHVELHAESE